eukprot:TRINITY_DN614_c0_g1_i2.p1 TRINITY_DN614_c0_g1~~TRINITY_DN614_c0_g1_i2.p1  ORF type:complete len:154 (+),score=48.26 TRINITY_DN614_c0_g1_i2:464-925(+)
MLIFLLSLIFLMFLHSTPGQLIFVELFLGAGCGGAMSMFIIVLAPAVHINDFSVITAMNLLFRILGSAVAPIASNAFVLSGMVYFQLSDSQSSVSSAEYYVGYKEKGFMEAWGLCLAVTVVCFAVSLFIPGITSDFQRCKKKGSAQDKETTVQ